jgi:polyferredoxin
MPTTKNKKSATYHLKLQIILMTSIVIIVVVFKMFVNENLKTTNSTHAINTRNYFLVPGILSSLLFIHQTGAHPSSSN